MSCNTPLDGPERSGSGEDCSEQPLEGGEGVGERQGSAGGCCARHLERKCCSGTPDRPSSLQDGRVERSDRGRVADLTVITPTIEGREDQLLECVESVQGQTVRAFHLIGLDQNRAGPAHVRNALVEQVDTTWVLFLDDDDVLDPDYIETVLPHFDQSDLVYTWCRKNFEYETDLPFDAKALRKRNVIPVTVCLRVDAFRAAGGFSDEVAHEDWSLWLKLLDMNATFTCVPEHKWEYRRSDTGRNAENNRKLAQGKLREV